MDKQDTDPQFKRELVYLRAVGKYRVGKLLEARRQLDELLKVSPDSHQAHQLKQAVEDQIIKEGLVGVGIVGGLLGVGAVILSAAFSRR
jgi:fission 1 protein